MYFILNILTVLILLSLNDAKANLAYITNEKDNSVSIIDIKKTKNS